MTVIYTASTLGIYHKSARIALHKRVTRRGYSTLKEHMPSQHRFYAEQSPEEMITQAKGIGDEVGALVEKIFQNKRCTQLSHRICLGIIDLSRRYGAKRVNRASRRALEFHSYSYKAVKNILEKGLDSLKEETLLLQSFLPIVTSAEETILTKGKVALSFQSNFQRIDEEGYKKLSPQLLKSSIWASYELPFKGGKRD